MDAIIIAGGVSAPEEPLYPFTAGKPKAMMDICGKPMIQWVLDAVEKASKVENVIIVGLPLQVELHCEKLLCFIPDQNSLLENIRTGVEKYLEINPVDRHIAVVSSDIPAIRPEHVDWVIETAMQTDTDVYYNVVKQAVMEARFPGSNRSYVHLKDMDVCGGDLNVLRASIVTRDGAFWERIIDSRKNALKQAALIGFDTLLLLLLRRLDLDGAIKKVTKRIHMTGRALVCPYAEIAMDVDKPHQLEIMRADLCTNKQEK